MENIDKKIKNFLIAVDHFDKDAYKLAEELTRLSDGKTLVPIFTKLLPLADKKTLIVICDALGSYKDASAAKELTLLLENKDPIVFKHIVWALAELKDNIAIEPLLRIVEELRNKEDAEAVYKLQRIAVALGEFNDIRVVSKLIALLLNSIDSDVSSFAFQSLQKLNVPILDLLLGETINQSEVVRANAVWALSQLGGKRTVNHLLQLLSTEKSPNVLIPIIFGLKKLRVKKSIPYLKILLNLDSKDRYGNRIKDVAFRAIQSLTQL